MAGRIFFLLCAACLTLISARITAAYDQGAFPVRVYVVPHFNAEGAQMRPVPAEFVLAVRQGVLDWNRLIQTYASIGTNDYALQILSRDQDEQDSNALNSVGLFQLVDKPDDADLAILPVDQRDLGSSSSTKVRAGIYRNTFDYRLGQIEVAARAPYSDGQPDSLETRAIVMHELGHALGLEHTPEQKCNLMSPSLYTCNTGLIPACRLGAPKTICVAIDSTQLAFVRAELESLLGHGPVGSSEAYYKYIDQLDQSIAVAIDKAGIWQKGSLDLEVTPDAQVRSVKVTASFGSPQLDRRIENAVAQLKLQPWPRILKEHAEDKEKVSLGFFYEPRELVNSYLLQVHRKIARQLPPGTFVPPTLDFVLTIGADGRVLKVERAHASGSPKIDQQISQALQTMRLPAIPASGEPETATLYYPGLYTAREAGLRAVESGPNKAFGHFLLGRAELALGNFEQASKAFTQATALNTIRKGLIMARSYAGRCTAQTRLGLLEQAAADCTRALQYASQHESGYLATAENLLARGLYAGAITYYDYAISLRPSARAYLGRAGAYLKMGDLEKAESDIAQSLALDPENPVAYLLQARLHENQNQLAKALSAYNRVLALDPNQAEAYLSRAQLYLKQGKKAEAKKDAALAASLYGQMQDQKSLELARKLLR